MSLRKDYHVIDHTGDYWSIEPLSTFKQACEFRAYVKYYLNRDLTLKIISSVKPEKITPIVKPKPKTLPLFQHLEF